MSGKQLHGIAVGHAAIDFPASATFMDVHTHAVAGRIVELGDKSGGTQHQKAAAGSAPSPPLGALGPRHWRQIVCWGLSKLALCELGACRGQGSHGEGG
jgi:hypothetical protein